VCQSAQCPNRGECFDRGTATFMILGSICTRNCRFCAIDKNQDTILPPNPNEANLIASLSNELKLKHIVVTTVTRDDLEDGGALQFVKVVKEIRKQSEINTSIELLISDLQGNLEALKLITDANPEVLNHNVETIPRLYNTVRPMANYQRSLNIIKKAKEFNPHLLTKSGLMVGLGETKEEILQVMQDLREVDCDVLTIGQYLSPSINHLPVKEYIHPDTFDFYRLKGLEMGFRLIESGPLVRSSYHAEKIREIK